MNISSQPSYDTLGKGYVHKRKTDPRIAEQINIHLRGAEYIVNIGAGTGSYEAQGYKLIAVEPSAEMIKQRAANAYPVVQAFAESLPFENKCFSHALTILSMHHWTNRNQAFAEINRVAKQKFVALTWNPAAAPFWLTADYFPEIYNNDVTIFPTVNELKQHFKNVTVSPLLIPNDCEDGFLAAYWRRPEAYLDAEVRSSISTFSKLSNLNQGLEKLQYDIDHGIWVKNNASLLEKDWFDAGYVIITGETS